MKTLEERVLSWIKRWDDSSEHRTGTRGDRATSQWLFEEIASLGAKPKLDEFVFHRRIPQNCHVTVGSRVLDGVPLFDGGVTPDTGIAEKLTVDPDGTGIFVVAPHASAQQQLGEVRRSRNFSGVIVISQLPRQGIALINADEFHRPFGLPVLQVPHESHDWLLAGAKDNSEARLTVTFVSEQTTASNVGARIPGNQADLPPLVVMTPKSAWYTCTAERMGGIVLWLECIRHFVKNAPDREIIFTANTGHELGHVGLDHFLSENSTLATDAYLWLHFGANFAARNCLIRTQASQDQHLDDLEQALSRFDVKVAHSVKPGTRPGGEARNIFDAGGNYLSLLGSNSLFHHPHDRLETNIDLDRLLKIRAAMLEVVHELSKRA